MVRGPAASVVEIAGRTLTVLGEEALTRGKREPGAGATASVLAAVERELLVQAHATTAGNITEMAQLPGRSRLTVREKLKWHGLRAEAAGESGPSD